MSSPLVTIICLCYNHAPYVREALDSVLAQTYSPLQLIIVDDASIDGSPEVILDYVEEHSLTSSHLFKLILNDKNEGNTTAFNKGLAHAKGEFFIDLAADDVLFPERVAHGVTYFQNLGMEYGVIYSNVEHIDSKGRHILNFYPDRKTYHPSGDLFRDLVRHTFISPPGMMMRMGVFEKLGGYDAILSYEDYDFWVRSSRYFLYAYEDEVLVKKRELPQSHSAGFQDLRSLVMLQSTLAVCKKARALSRGSKDFEALAEALRYYLRQCALLGHEGLAREFYVILEEMEMQKASDKAYVFLAKLPIRQIYSLYRKLRH